MPLPNWQFIQVVPRLLPGRCGVSDQAVFLAEELRSAFGIETAFLILNSNERCSVPFNTAYCAPSELQQASLSVSQGRPVALLVHLSGYGYAADGAPTLLAEALSAAKADGRFHIAVYFHELYATGMPWQSAFWYSRKQKKAVRAIAWESDLCATSIGYFADWLERKAMWQTAMPIQVLPVFSGVGEAAAPIPVAQREPVLVAFGLPATRARAYKKLLSLAGMLPDLGVREILDIGAEFDAPSSVHGVPVRRMGTLAASELGQELSRARFGVLSYFPLCLAKSSVFASYCAQGTIPFITEPFSAEVDGLTDGIQLLSPRTARAAQASGLDRYSLAAWNWYQGHRLRVHASTYAAWLNQLATNAMDENRMTAAVEEA